MAQSSPVVNVDTVPIGTKMTAGDIEEGDNAREPSTVVTDLMDEPGSLFNATRSPRENRHMSFVDYTPPPTRSIKPPAKFKLWFMVLFCVFFADWFASEAHILKWLQDNLGFSFNGSLFVLLGTIVGVLVFAMFDILTFCLRIKIGGEWYGLGRWLKQPRIKWIHEYDNAFMDLVAGLVVVLEDGIAMFNVAPPPKNDKPKFFDSDKSTADHEVVLKIENRIKVGKDAEYLHWKDRIIKQGCHSRPGMLSSETETIKDDIKGNTYVVYLKFDSLDHLNDYMNSPVRERLVRKLQPILAVPSVVQLQKDRVLPDAFTDLCTTQGSAVPARLPKKWKVWWLTTLGLFFTVLITNATIFDHYFEEYDINDMASRVQALFRVFCNTWINTYVMTPFLTMTFGAWLKRGQEERKAHEPWRSLNDGFATIWSKVALAFLFYGGCALAWIID